MRCPPKGIAVLAADAPRAAVGGRRSAVGGAAPPGAPGGSPGTAPRRRGAASGIAGRTTLLVAGAKAGSKVAKAQEAGIEIVGAEAFAERIGAFLTS